MAKSKIVDEQEVLRWFAEGRTYQWMVDEYRRKYGIETAVSMWSNFRRRRGLKRRAVRDDQLIPWRIKPEHMYDYNVVMLRFEARRRAGYEIDRDDAVRLAAWKRTLRELDAVVHYDPDTEEGFHLIPRDPDRDKDLIHEPPASQRRSPTVD